MDSTTQLVKWTPALSIDIEEIDDQHKKLVDLLNKFFVAMKSANSSIIITDILKELSNYTVYHFDTEEKYFKKFNYPEASTHIQQHNFFKTKINDIGDKLSSNDLASSIDLINYLVNWIQNHIKVIDKKYTNFFKEHGVK